MQKDKSLGLVYTMTVLTMFVWGFSFVWMKQLYEIGFGPLTVVFFRLIVASSMMILLCAVLKKDNRIEKGDFKYLFLLAFFEPFCYFLGEGFGMLYVTATVASTMVALIPLLTPILAWVFIKEKVTLSQIIGLLVSFIGVIILVVDDLNLGGKLIGFLLMGLAVLAGTMFGIFLKRMADKYSAFTVTKYQTMIGMLLFLPLFFIFEYQGFCTLVVEKSLGISDFQYVIYLGVLASSFAFVILSVTVRHIGVVRMNVFTNLIPVFTAVTAFYVLGELFTVGKMIAICVVLIGLFLSQFRNIKFFQRRVS